LQPLNRKSCSSGSSLFASRSQSGELKPVISTTASKSLITRAGGSNLAIEDEDDISADFDEDTDFSKEEGAYITSQSSKLSEVEKKLAAMEKDNADLVSLRLESDLRGSKNDPIDKNEVSFDAEGDYSEEDFESGSETKDQDESEQGDEDDAEESKSVASEDIEAMELSVGGAGSDSDTSFSGLNSDSLLKKGVEKGGSSSSAKGSLSSATVSASKTPASSTSSYKPSVPKKKSSDEQDLSQSSADLEFSVSEFETSGSKGIDGDAGYDFTAAAIPPINAGRGPRSRSGGW
jgi:hypothetical protein